MSTTHIEERPRVILPRASRASEIIAILLLAAGLLLALCLISAAFYPNDPSWNSVGQSETQNWAGAIGANVAATAFQFIGLAAYLLPLLLFAAAWRRFRRNAIQSPLARIAGLLVLVVAASALLSISQLRPLFDSSVQPGGLLGSVVAQGLASGLYLDMRDTRKWLRGEVQSGRVLNCFAYTCGFGICARAGGAERVVNVDLSRRALEWGQQNARLNGQAVAGQDYLCGDVLDWLRRFRKRQEQFDFVVLDPPSFATAKGTQFTASSDWPRLIASASSVVERTGIVLACCNQASLPLERFERMVRRGFETASQPAALVQRLGASKLDFPSLPAKRDSLKVLAYRLD